jgi:hypothetical protein
MTHKNCHIDSNKIAIMIFIFPIQTIYQFFYGEVRMEGIGEGSLHVTKSA